MKQIRVVISAPWPETGDFINDSIKRGEIAMAIQEWIGEPKSDFGITVSPAELVEINELRVGPASAPALALPIPGGAGSKTSDVGSSDDNSEAGGAQTTDTASGEMEPIPKFLARSKQQAQPEAAE